MLAALGPAVWVGYERSARLLADRRGVVALELYGNPGLQLGFAGPGYFARHSDVFAGYGYTFGGPPALALRFPAGARLRWARGWFDTYVEAVPVLTLTPSIDVLFGLAVGTRVRF